MDTGDTKYWVENRTKRKENETNKKQSLQNSAFFDH